MSEFALRRASPTDYEAIIAVVDAWWDRPMTALLPRLFLDHFHATSFVISDQGGLAAFLVGLLSPSQSDIAYIHFIGVRPDVRTAGLARRLYQEFFALALADGRSTVHAITSVTNERSIAFHRRMGFQVDGPVDDYNGPGTALMVFTRPL